MGELQQRLLHWMDKVNNDYENIYWSKPQSLTHHGMKTLKAMTTKLIDELRRDILKNNIVLNEDLMVINRKTFWKWLGDMEVT